MMVCHRCEFSRMGRGRAREITTIVEVLHQMHRWYYLRGRLLRRGTARGGQNGADQNGEEPG